MARRALQVRRRVDLLLGRTMGVVEWFLLGVEGVHSGVRGRVQRVASLERESVDEERELSRARDSAQ